MPDKPRNQFERKCKVCDQYGVPTADGKVLHFNRIAACRENVVVEGVVDGAQVVADGVEGTTSTIHTPDIVQGIYGESGRDYKAVTDPNVYKDLAFFDRAVTQEQAYFHGIAPNPDQ